LIIAVLAQVECLGEGFVEARFDMSRLDQKLAKG